MKKDKKLWDKNGEYIGWKIGKPWFEKHGPHELIEINSSISPVVVCKICKVRVSDYKIEDVVKTTFYAPTTLTSKEGVFYVGNFE